MLNMYSCNALSQEVETDASDMNGECLIADFVHELTPALEMPFILEENINAIDSTENFGPLDSIFCDEPEKERWMEDPFKFINTCENILVKKDESNKNLQSFFEMNNIERTCFISGLSRSGSGSGSSSECSSSELWHTKVELDTPPVTPPDERISPDNVFLLPPEELKCLPICADEILQGEDAIYKSYEGSNKKMRIQPKPIFSTTFNAIDTPCLGAKTVAGNIFNDLNSNNLKNQDGALKPKIFFSSNYGKKKMLTKKDLELQVRRKQERMIRNRESAYLSRKRKKEHVAHLEKLVHDLQAENKQLKLENSSLRNSLAKYEKSQNFLQKKSGNPFTDSPRKTTALLALLFTVCLNIGSFSSLINERKVYSENDIMRENIVSNYPRKLHHTRSLLWADNDLSILNSSYTNLTKTSCPLLVNHTESIRLESELRRWIGDEEYSKKAKQNVSKVNQYFYSGEKPALYKKLSKQNKRFLKSSIQNKNLEMKMYQMNILNYNNLFEAIHRRDDTFYLVSFSSDHLLLPALSHNQSSRPKMSLMLPAFLSNGTEADQVEMMQIDCEVTNTQLLSVNENDIPSHMRPYSNSTSRSKSKSKSETKNIEEYFVSDLPVTLIPTKKVSFIKEKNDLTYSNISENYTNFFSQSSKNISKFRNFVFNFQSSQSNFTLSQSKNYEVKHSDYLKYKKHVFSYQLYKQDPDTVDFTSSSGKNLLKLLMVGSTTNFKPVKFNYTKSSPEAYRNSTKF